MSLPDRIKIVEVGARDGLQNEPRAWSIASRIELINRLSDTGLKVIEAGSFVSPEWVPQMANSAEVFLGLNKKSGVSYPVLVPNLQGLDEALGAGVTEVAIFAAASESFSKKNINCSIDDSINRYSKVTQKAINNGIRVRAYVSCVLGCPYEGDIPLNTVASVSEKLFKMGCYEISLGDTIGVGTPLKAQHLVEKVSRVVPVERLAAHFHDTHGQALANIEAVLQLGVATIDSAVGGLGGCPYADGATGNVATEKVIDKLEQMRIKTDVDSIMLQKVIDFIDSKLQR